MKKVYVLSLADFIKMASEDVAAVEAAAVGSPRYPRFDVFEFRSDSVMANARYLHVINIRTGRWYKTGYKITELVMGE